MHIKPMTKARPAEAQSVEVLLDLVNQIIGTLLGLERLLGFDISGFLTTTFPGIFKGE